jgi:MYXO-CTERM domain-containing protein
MSTHRTLMSSALLASVAGVSVLAGPATGAVTIYTDEATLNSILSNPLNADPNGVFTNGINPGLEVRTNNGNGLTVNTPGPYNGNITSSVVGAFQSYTNLIVDPTSTGAAAIGMDLWGIGTFIASPMNGFEYTVYDNDGGILANGNVDAPDAATTGHFFGVASDTDAIGWVEINGTAFGLSTNEFIDNVQVWGVPAPGALALLGLAGLAGTRRRRA